MSNNPCFLIMIWLVFAILLQVVIFYYVTLPKLESGQYNQYNWNQYQTDEHGVSLP